LALAGIIGGSSHGMEYGMKTLGLVLVATFIFCLFQKVNENEKHMEFISVELRR
jgi:hypothetical protein